MTTRILVVCLGNICRSPMGQGVIEKRAAEAGLSVTVDSAGLGAWHIGNPPEGRGLQVAAARGYDNTAQRARQVHASDFHDFDLILGMDMDNISGLERLRPKGAQAQIRLFHPAGKNIPDPYYGDLSDFHLALDMIEEATDSLITELSGKL